MNSISMFYIPNKDLSKDAKQLLEDICLLEDNGVLDEQDVKECVYYMKKIAEVAGFQIDLDDLNDENL